MFYLFIPFLISQISAHAEDSLQKKYPDIMLTNDYAIVSEVDILYDIKKHGRGASLWQCFETSKVEFRYNTWKESDPLGPSNIIVTLCDFHFQAKDLSGIKQIYYGRRARQVEGCRMYFDEWKQLRKSEKYACFIGEAGSYDNGEKWWVWGKTKTKNGCMSYFVGECDSEKKLKEYEKEK
jgi:hypothetical protein